MKDRMRKLLICILLFISIFCAYNIYTINKDYNIAKDEYENLSSAFTSSENSQEQEDIQDTIAQETVVNKDQSTENQEAQTQENNKLLDLKKIDFESLTSLNSDIVGWITLPGTIIDYPIVHSKDNKEYLKLTFLKESSSSGSIFIDKNNKSDFSDYNTIVYGHNMKNGTMFKTLREYSNKEFYKNNPYIQIYTLKNSSNYKIISCYYTRYNSDTYSQDFTNKSEYEEWLKKITERSLYNVEKYDLTKNTITLSTCSGVSGSGERWVVHLQKMD